jgi:tellurite resistance-related uncharacterized protein
LTLSAALPPGLVAYRRTPIFDQDTIPVGLRRQHRTRPGVWGLITVVEGSLRFRTLAPFSEVLLAPGSPAVVAPEAPHEVAPDGPVRFFLEFYRAADAAGS